MTHQHAYRIDTRAAEEGDDRRVCHDCGWVERVIVLPYIPPGSNAIKRMHFHQVARLRRDLHDDMALLIFGHLPLPDRVPERAHITLDFAWRTKHRRDPSNFVEGMKAAIDALIGFWLVDDDTEHLVLTAKGRVGTGEPDHVTLTLEEV